MTVEVVLNNKAMVYAGAGVCAVIGALAYDLHNSQRLQVAPPVDLNGLLYPNSGL